MKGIWVYPILVVIISLFLIVSSISCLSAEYTSNVTLGDINALKSTLEKDGITIQHW